MAECTTRSTPNSAGLWASGVANVESTTVIGPAMAPTSARSITSSLGLAGDSAITSTVRPGMTASAKAPGSVPSTKVTPMPKRGQAVCSSSCVPP